MKKVLLIVVALTLVLTAYALAGDNVAHKVAIHVRAHGNCKTAPTGAANMFTSCTEIVTTYAGGGDIDAVPVFFDLAGFKLNELGMSWPEASWGYASWSKCKGDVAVGVIMHSAVPEVPAHTAGKLNGTAIAWSTCQTSWMMAAGFAWMVAADPGMICPVPNPATDMMGVTDCGPLAAYDPPRCAFCAGVLGMVGDDPCLPTANEPSTWGEIKSIFK